MFPVTEILDKEFVARDSSHRELWRCCALDAHWVATQIGRCFRTLIRIVCVSAVSTFAILVPSLGGTLGIMGGFCFIFIGALNGCDVCATDSQSCMQECYSLCYSSWSCLKRSWVVASSGGWLFLQSLQAQWVCWLLWMQSSTRSVEIRCRDCLHMPSTTIGFQYLRVRGLYIWLDSWIQKWNRMISLAQITNQFISILVRNSENKKSVLSWLCNEFSNQSRCSSG